MESCGIGTISGNRKRAIMRRSAGFPILAFYLSTAFLLLAADCPGQSVSSQAMAKPTDSPRPQNTTHAALPPLGPCQLRNTGAAVAAAGALSAVAASGADSAAGALPPPVIKPAPCPVYVPIINWYARFLNGPQVKPLTPKEKAWLAVRNVSDPFNLITILGDSGIAVASNSHSGYGPGMPGFARNVGVSLTQDMTGEFFGTFLIPSIVHQDPHYHRMPHATIPRRAFHAIAQVLWTQGDNGRGMVNYANLVGFAIDDEISNLYVPDRQTDLPASAARYTTTLASAPIDNFITEFLPDVARHVHVQVVVIQRIIDQVARTGSTPEQ